MATKAPTSVTNPDGSVTSTTYNPDGSVYETETVKQNADGSKTIQRQFASGEQSILKYDASGNFLGTAAKNPDGTLSFSPAPGTNGGTSTRTTYSADGSTPLNRVTYNQDGSQQTDYLNPDGTVNRTETKTAQQIRDQQIADATAKDTATNLYNPSFGKIVKQNITGAGQAVGGFIGSVGSGVKDWFSGIDQGANGNTSSIGATPGSSSSGSGSGGGGSYVPSTYTVPTLPTNVAGTANRTGTQAAAPTPISAPDNGFRASLTAGTVDQQPAITSQAVQAGQAGYGPQVQATTINAPNNGFQAGVRAGEVAVQPNIQAQQIEAPQNNFKAGVTAGTVATQPAIQGQQIGSTLSPDQQQAIDLAKAQATGTAPSAAQALLQKGIDQNVGAAYGLAASLSGRNAGQALLQGSASAQSAIAKSSADMAALRAQEIAQGTQTFGTLATNAAGQNLSRLQSNQATDLQSQIATAQNTIQVLTGNRDAALKAGLQNQADTLTAAIENQKEKLSALQSNQTADLTAKIQSVQNTINVLTGNRDAALKAGLQNQADQLQADINNANNQLAALQSNQATALAASTANARNATDVNIANAGYATQAGIASAANALQAQIQTAQNNIRVMEGNRDAALKAGMQNQADTLTAQINNANNQLDAMKANLAATTQTNISNANNATQMSVADLQAFTTAMGLNSAQATAVAQMGLQAWIASQDQATKNRAIDVAAQTAANSSNNQFWGAVLGGLSTVGAAYLASDRRLKTKVASGEREARSFLDSLTAQTWDYKSPRDGIGRKLGVMAQDVASTPRGRTFVLELPDGRGLGLDPAKAIGPVLAGLASINDRLKRLEGRRG